MLLGLFLLIVLPLFLLLKFSVEFKLVASGSKMEPALTVGVGRFRAAVPPALLARMGEMLRRRPMRNVSEAFARANTALRIVDQLLQEVEFFQLEIWFGLHDPYWTALGCGGFWAALGSLVSALSTKPRFKDEPKIAVHPNFSQTTLEVYLRCIFRFRVGQIIFSEMKRLGQAWLA